MKMLQTSREDIITNDMLLVGRRILLTLTCGSRLHQLLLLWACVDKGRSQRAVALTKIGILLPILAYEFSEQLVMLLPYPVELFTVVTLIATGQSGTGYSNFKHFSSKDKL